MEAFLGIWLIIFGIFVVLLPGLIARHRRHRNTTAIFVCAIVGILFYGIGWLIALIWSLTDNVKREE
ncbi:MAG: DUF3302 domain-containing protein [Gammaproteobacteria bacterium]